MVLFIDFKFHNGGILGHFWGIIGPKTLKLASSETNTGECQINLSLFGLLKEYRQKNIQI